MKAIHWRRKPRASGDGWFALPEGSGGSAARPAAMMRLAHPTERKYYDASKAEWTLNGYTTWTAERWKAKFGHLQPDGLKWEQFGYLIPLYDDDDPNKVR